jgi:hypothetical protein
MAQPLSARISRSGKGAVKRGYEHVLTAIDLGEFVAEYII